MFNQASGTVLILPGGRFLSLRHFVELYRSARDDNQGSHRVPLESRD